MQSYQYRKSHYGDKTVVRSSHFYNGIFFTGRMASLYWISHLVLRQPADFLVICILVFLQQSSCMQKISLDLGDGNLPISNHCLNNWWPKCFKLSHIVRTYLVKVLILHSFAFEFHYDIFQCNIILQRVTRGKANISQPVSYWCIWVTHSQWIKMI